jgi:hypothetical protein
LPDFCGTLGERVAAELRGGLPPAVARRLQVRVYQLGPKVKG